MSDKLAVNGKVVRVLSHQTDTDLARAKKHMLGSQLALASALGSGDPVEYHKAISTAQVSLTKAMDLVEKSHVANRSISDICKMAAIRGRYKKRK